MSQSAPLYNKSDFARIAYWPGGYWLGRPIGAEGMFSLLHAKHRGVMPPARMGKSWNDEVAGKTATFGVWARNRLLWTLTHFPQTDSSFQGYEVDLMMTMTRDLAAVAAAWGVLQLPIDRMSAVFIKGTHYLESLGPTTWDVDVEPYRLLGLKPLMQPVVEFKAWYEGMLEEDASS